MDPRVLRAHVVEPIEESDRAINLSSSDTILLPGHNRLHLLIDRGSPIRLDIAAGANVARPVILHFDVADDARIEHQLAAIRALHHRACPAARYIRFADRLAALYAVDARADGANLREIGDMLLGPGDWPGDGEHRKSRVRRLLAAGYDMITHGARAILASS